MFYAGDNKLQFNDFVAGEPGGRTYLHMDFGLDFRWNTKENNDRDNGYVCKKPATAAA